MKKLVLLLLLLCLSGCQKNPTMVSVSFQANNGEAIATVTCEAKDEITLPTPTRTGYVFNGWQSPSGVHFDHATFDIDTILYARWTIAVYTVTFIDYDETILSTQQVNYQDDAKEPAIPTRSGYSFTGWSQIFTHVTTNLTISAEYELSTEGLEYTFEGDHYEVTGYHGTSTNLIIPSRYNGVLVTAIATSAFEGNILIESVQLPASITLIQSRAFYECLKLSEINIPSAVEVIGERAFFGCESLLSITIPAAIIGPSAFYYCSHLSTIELLEGVTTLSDSAFLGCADLVTIYLPSSITIVDDHIFSWCRALTTIYTPADNVANLQSMLASITLIYLNNAFHVEARN